MNLPVRQESATLTLDDLAVEIREAHLQVENAARSTVEHAIRAGELLIEAKAKVKHGEWLPWLEANFPGSERTARGYMQVASNRQRVADLGSYREALAELAEPRPAPKPASPEGVEEGVLVPALAEPDSVQRAILESKLSSDGEEVAREHAASMGVAYPVDLDTDAGADAEVVDAEVVLEPPTPIRPAAASTPHPPRDDAGWSAFERRARREIEQGRAVAAHVVNHPNLIAWAKERGCFKLVDSSTEWGNPFRRGEDGDHETVARLFADHYMPFKVALRRRLPELHGRVLGAYDAPEPGHAQVLAELANDCRADRRAA